MARGRQVGLTKKLMNKLIPVVQKTGSMSKAAKANKIPPPTVYFWRSQGRKAKDGLLKEFAEKVDRAIEEYDNKTYEGAKNIVYDVATFGTVITEEEESYDENGALISTKKKKKHIHKDWRAANAIINRLENRAIRLEHSGKIKGDKSFRPLVIANSGNDDDDRFEITKE